MGAARRIPDKRAKLSGNVRVGMCEKERCKQWKQTNTKRIGVAGGRGNCSNDRLRS
jgi:hypothetical protein